MSNFLPSEGSAPQKDPTHPESNRDVIRKWFKKNRSQLLFFLGGLALYLLLGLSLWWLLQLYVDPSSIKDPSKEATAKKDLLQALGFIMAGVAGAIGIYFTWRGQRLTQESNREELRITREGQITERFTRAIDQLGKVEGGQKLFEIRVGGIYALERIARESEEDYWSIIEVLTAYVRQHAPWPPEEAHDDKRAEVKPIEPPIPDPDIEAIITVLARRKHYFGGVEPEPIDLHETFLWRANFWRADLVGANFSGANLWNANFFKANLSAAYLSDAILWRADFTEANLSGANLRRASLSGAYLSGADLSNTDVLGRNVPTNLLGADLSGADLSGANLSGAVLRRADFSKADFLDRSVPVNLLGPDSQVRNVPTNLSEANLSGADLSEAIISQAQLEQATGDENTVLPSDLKPPVHWGVKTDEQTEED